MCLSKRANCITDKVRIDLMLIVLLMLIKVVIRYSDVITKIG